MDIIKLRFSKTWSMSNISYRLIITLNLLTLDTVDCYFFKILFYDLITKNIFKTLGQLSLWVSAHVIVDHNSEWNNSNGVFGITRVA